MKSKTILMFIVCGICFSIPYIISKLFYLNLEYFQLDYLLMFYGGMVYRHFIERLKAH